MLFQRTTYKIPVHLWLLIRKKCCFTFEIEYLSIPIFSYIDFFAVNILQCKITTICGHTIRLDVTCCSEKVPTLNVFIKQGTTFTILKMWTLDIKECHKNQNMKNFFKNEKLCDTSLFFVSGKYGVVHNKITPLTK